MGATGNPTRGHAPTEPIEGTPEGKAMTTRLRSFATTNQRVLTLTGIAVLHVTAMVMMRQLLPLYLESTGSSAGIIGIVTSLFSFMPLLVALPGGTITDFVGYRIVMVSGSAALAATALLLSTLPTTLPVMISQLLAGLGHILVLLAAQAYVANLGGGRERARNFAIFFSGPPIGFLVGPPLAGFLRDTYGFGTAFLVGGAISTVVALWCLRVQEIGVTDRGQQSLLALLREELPHTLRRSGSLLKSPAIRLSMIVSVSLLMVMTLRTSFLLIHLEDLGLSALHIGIVVAAVSAVSLVLRPFMSNLIGRFGQLTVLTGAFSIGAAGLGILATAETFGTLILGATLFGVAPAYVLPVSLAILTANAPDDIQGMAIGLRQTGNPVGLMVGPLLFGVVTSYLGAGLAIALGGIILLGMAIATRFLTADDD